MAYSYEDGVRKFCERFLPYSPVMYFLSNMSSLDYKKRNNPSLFTFCGPEFFFQLKATFKSLRFLWYNTLQTEILFCYSIVWKLSQLKYIMFHYLLKPVRLWTVRRSELMSIRSYVIFCSISPLVADPDSTVTWRLRSGSAFKKKKV